MWKTAATIAAVFVVKAAVVFDMMACLSDGVPAAPVPEHRSNACCLHLWMTAM